MKQLFLASALVGFVSLPVLAQTDSLDRPGVFLGGNYGGFKARGGEFDDDRDLVEAVGGFRLNRYLALEGNYIDFGEYGSSLASADVDGWGVAFTGRLPLTRTFGVYAKAGQFFWDAETEVAGIRDDQDGDEPFYGVGVDFAITERVQLIAEYNRFDVDLDDDSFAVPVRDSDTDLDVAKIGVRFHL
jgi:hypothetical protein